MKVFKVDIPNWVITYTYYKSCVSDRRSIFIRNEGYKAILLYLYLQYPEPFFERVNLDLTLH